MSPQKCHLRCVNSIYKSSFLPNLTPVYVGRSRETQIQLIKCSKRQVVLIADYETKEVIVKVLGPNPSRVDGILLKRNECLIVRHEALIELLDGVLGHRIFFDPPPNETPVTSPAHKRTSSLFNVSRPLGVDESSTVHTPLRGNLITNSVKRTSKDVEVSVAKKLKTGSQFVWQQKDGGKIVICETGASTDMEKIAAFDLDGTLIKTKSGLVFPKDTTDWVILNDVVKRKLHELIDQCYKIVIFTNQAAIGRGRLKLADFKKKIENIISELEIPALVLIATCEDINRKPAPGMWDCLVTMNNEEINLESSFYVGDAAGRVDKWEKGKKKDFSCSDRLFSLNVGLKFYTPEEFFLGRPPARYETPLFDPSSITVSPVDIDFIGEKLEVVVMVGAPGSGKSTFVRDYLKPKGYLCVSRDQLHSWQKCVSAVENALSAKKKVVVDNTNPDIASRKRFIEAAKKYSVQVRCFKMTTTIEHCQHNNKFREFTDDKHEPISPIIINQYRKSYVEPCVEEGFFSVVDVPFIPTFQTPKLEKLYKMHLFCK